jgi:pyroglutamyl-peptidase
LKILLTGFNRFKGVRVNPSEKVILELRERYRDLKGVDLIAEVLPTEYGAGMRKLRGLIRKHRPQAILLLGVAPRREQISLERVALNIDDEATPDNAGVIRRGRKIVRGAADVYWSTLPLLRLQRALEGCGIPASISNHAGTFLCNHAFYVARHQTERSPKKLVCGFVHLPGMASRRAKTKSTTKSKSKGERAEPNKMIQAIECCIEVLRRTK